MYCEKHICKFSFFSIYVDGVLRACRSFDSVSFIEILKLFANGLVYQVDQGSVVDELGSRG